MECMALVAKRKRIKVLVTQSLGSLPGFVWFSQTFNPCLCRLQTAKELQNLGIPVTIILDGAVGFHMRSVNAVLVGAEAVAESGGSIARVSSSAFQYPTLFFFSLVFIKWQSLPRNSTPPSTQRARATSLREHTHCPKTTFLTNRLSWPQLPTQKTPHRFLGTSVLKIFKWEALVSNLAFEHFFPIAGFHSALGVHPPTVHHTPVHRLGCVDPKCC